MNSKFDLSTRKSEQVAGLIAFVEKFLGLTITDREAVDALDMMSTRLYIASVDLPRLIKQVRLRQ
jgi:hypothetical protein